MRSQDLAVAHATNGQAQPPQAGVATPTTLDVPQGLNCLPPWCWPDTISLASGKQFEAWVPAIRLSRCLVLTLSMALHLLLTARMLGHQHQEGTSPASHLRPHHTHAEGQHPDQLCTGCWCSDIRLARRKPVGPPLPLPEHPHPGQL